MLVTKLARGLLYLCSAGAVVLVGMMLFYGGARQPGIITSFPFVIAVLVVALMWGRGPAIVAALTASAVFNYLFSPPFDTDLDLPTAENVVLMTGLLAVAFGLGTAINQMRALRADMKESAERERFQEILLGCVSHDLKTPLTGVIGSLSTLIEERDALAGDVRDELLTIAFREAKQLDRLVTQVLEMTRLEAGALVVRREPCELGTLIHGVLQHLRETVGERPCRVDVSPTLPAVALDPIVFPHALINIVDNAVKYSPAGSPIEIAAWEDRGEAVIIVADRGIGIPAEHLHRVFEKFHRLRQLTSEAGVVGGTGLGLAIAKGIVEAHGGRIWAEQREGNGTIVKMRLPIRGGLDD